MQMKFNYPNKIKQPTSMMYTEKWGEIISDWLFEDSKLKKKLRRNKKALFKDLQALRFNDWIVNTKLDNFFKVFKFEFDLNNLRCHEFECC